MRSAALAVVLVLAACGSASTPSAQSSSGAIASPIVEVSGARTSAPGSSPGSTAPAPGLLFAVVERAPSGIQADTVAIVGLDGYARAKAKFQPRRPPGLPDRSVPLQGVAQVARLGVYYIDGSGTVRLLQVNRPPQVVATFAHSLDQVETWYAIAPDGSRIVAGLLTFPVLGPPTTDLPMGTLVGPWKFDLETAQAGGQPTVLRHFESALSPEDPGANWKPTFPVGWTAAGAVAMAPLRVDTDSVWTGGPLYLLGDAGNQLHELGGSGCDSASITPAGLIPCISSSDGSVTVRDSSGNVIWVTRASGFTFDALTLQISPDGQAISDGGSVVHTPRGTVALPPYFFVEGWLDRNTVIGRVQVGPGYWNESWVSLSDPGTLHDLGFKGDFVGTLPAPT